MTLTLTTVAKWVVVVGGLAAAVLGAVNPTTLPHPVAVVLVIVGALGVYFERYLSTGSPVAAMRKAGKAPPA